MKKLTKEQVKGSLNKRPCELTLEELSFIFYIFSFQIKEYYGELIKLLVNMFYDNLLSSANYTATYDEEESMFDSPEEASEYLKFVQYLI